MENKLSLIDAIGGLSWGLYQKLSGSDNMVFSPCSIYVALAMAAIGGGGKTLEEFKKYLLFQNVKELAKNLEELQSTLSKKVDGLEISVVNKIYQGLPQLKEEYNSMMTKKFRSVVQQVNFSEHSEEVRQEINQWVETVTSKKISNLLPEGCISNQTRMLLVNAVYFKGEWMHQFQASSTLKVPFNLEYEQSGKTVQVDMMKIEESFEYFENQEFQYIALQYRDGKEIQEEGPCKMEILLPRNSLAQFEKTNPILALQEARSNKHIMKVNVQLPRFKIAGSNSVSLKNILQSLGLNDAFSKSADFSFMDPNNSIFISDVFHKAMIEVNEKGTEATASTAVIMNRRCMVLTQEFICNKPFIYTISHNKTSSLLFLGKFTQPSS